MLSSFLFSTSTSTTTPVEHPHTHTPTHPHTHTPTHPHTHRPTHAQTHPHTTAPPLRCTSFQSPNKMSAPGPASEPDMSLEKVREVLQGMSLDRDLDQTTKDFFKLMIIHFGRPFWQQHGDLMLAKAIGRYCQYMVKFPSLPQSKLIICAIASSRLVLSKTHRRYPS
ncbi:hypothetical protein BD324DRAFT_487185 [Kockovaella imperatae]|uniref:Uncharacterized protein n=1 Tax=Kockovaella imperatae TaxID=4999 RepID=A0A1Y1UE54_9TREE|nr:hypothetical protein BD324DRAFT_487185 [Kockovaella imperatae]ORX36302.1 hypothetical protein BD324DRAFT_487185 [Kockovaella imperatae]